jgi:hypothetical protein
MIIHQTGFIRSSIGGFVIIGEELLRHRFSALCGSDLTIMLVCVLQFENSSMCSQTCHDSSTRQELPNEYRLKKSGHELTISGKFSSHLIGCGLRGAAVNSWFTRTHAERRLRRAETAAGGELGPDGSREATQAAGKRGAHITETFSIFIDVLDSTLKELSHFGSILSPI